MTRSRLNSLVAFSIFCISTSMAAQVDKIRHKPDKVDNEYIVVLNDDTLPDQVPAIARQLSQTHRADLRKSWNAALKGFFAVMTEERARAMSNDPHVKFIEENARIYLSSTTQTQINPGTCDPTVTSNCPLMTDNRLWHLDRADQNYADPTASYSYCTTGNGVTIYVVDTGVVATHAEFGSRVQTGFNATGTADPPVTDDGMPANDPCFGFDPVADPSSLFANIDTNHYTAEWQLNGHGTAVASAAAGTRVGIGKQATIVPIKVVRCDENASRYRRPSTFYRTNQTMYIYNSNQESIYRALNDGYSSSEDPFTSEWFATWPIGTTLNPKPTRTDGTITWQFVPVSDWLNPGTTQMLIDGVNWILKPENPGPKSYAVVTFSTYVLSGDPKIGAFEDAVKSLLNNNLVVTASANNQNGDACDTSPGRMSLTNSGVITVGGSMLLNRPWTVNLSDPPAVSSDGAEADGSTTASGTPTQQTPKGFEPQYDSTKGVRDARWICGAGDSDGCSNATPTSTIAVTDPNYRKYTAGSNGGQCVTLFAPAKNLCLARNAGANDYRDARLRDGLASGTSFSAPIAAGFAARILQANPNSTPTQVRNIMLQNVSSGVLDPNTLDPYDYNGVRITGTPNKVLRLADINITSPPQSTPISSNGPTTFSITAAGTFAVSYQWYQVNTGFDYVTYPRGAHSSTPIGTNSNTLQVSPTATTAYWVRVSNACGSVDSDIVLATALNAPTGLVASTDGSGTGVTITWNAVANATGYQLQRSTTWTGTFADVGASVTGTSTTDNPPVSASDQTYVYRVVALNGTMRSESSNRDYATVATLLFHDAAIVATQTVIAKQHILDLRAAVDAVRAALGATPAAWTDPLTFITRTSLNEVRTNLDAARNVTTVALGNYPYTNAIVVGNPVLKRDMDETRNAVK